MIEPVESFPLSLENAGFTKLTGFAREEVLFVFGAAPSLCIEAFLEESVEMCTLW